ncbi:MAG TPA: Ig-like domain-containing protein [Terracidiphilus sp.]|jgi:hypothetical protein|nr:Ig-like domain-containing protein [Terracidiphilus sp.]
MNIVTNATTLTLLFASLAIPAAAAVTVASPANGAQVSSPFNLTANASSCSAQTIAAMGYSLDNSSSTTIVYSSSVNVQVQASSGTHTLHVKSWGNQGSVCVNDVAIAVLPVTTVMTNAAAIPSNAVSVSGIQTLGNWAAASDSGAAGSSIGATALGNSPSLSGTARKFATTYSNYGDERYSAAFGDDTASTNFLYDAWLYVSGPSSGIANVEMDMNQVMPNHQTVIFGFQCDGWAGTWDYTANVGTPQNPVDTWLHSTASCNPRQWSANAWHHIQVSYSRDSSGNVIYKSVWFDGTESIINQTVLSAFALGWSPTLLTNFQVDGATAGSGSSTIYLDQLTVYRW